MRDWFRRRAELLPVVLFLMVITIYGLALMIRWFIFRAR